MVYAEYSSEEDTPLASSPDKKVTAPLPPISTAVNGSEKSRRKAKKEVSSDQDDEPQDPPKKKSRPRSTKPPKKKAKKAENDDALDVSEEEDDDVPVQKKPRKTRKKRQPKLESDAGEPASENDRPVKKKASTKRTPNKPDKKEDISETEVVKPKKTTGKAKEEPNGSPKKSRGKKKEEEEEEEEIFKWWEAGDPNGDGSEKWQTLEHNGVIFPPPYEPLPSDVKMKYNGNHNSLLSGRLTLMSFPPGKSVDLPLAAEEVAAFYAAMLETDHAQDATFNKNFFDDWKTVLKENPPVRGSFLIIGESSN